jgi:hypothetical protein
MQRKGTRNCEPGGLSLCEKVPQVSLESMLLAKSEAASGAKKRRESSCESVAALLLDFRPASHGMPRTHEVSEKSSPSC